MENYWCDVHIAKRLLKEQLSVVYCGMSRKCEQIMWETDSVEKKAAGCVLISMIMLSGSRSLSI